MALEDDISWFKGQFGDAIDQAIAGTPLTVDLICAIALQETGYLWRPLLSKSLATRDILRLCVGDTLDFPRRKAFPKNRDALVEKPNGDKMFALARSLLEEMAHTTGNSAYLRQVEKPDKFVRGYGIFQRDLQFFLEDPSYFLDQQWTSFGACLGEAIAELKQGLANLRLADKTSLTDLQLAFVAIVYNMGFRNFRASRGLKQGHEDDNGVFYGEHIARFLKRSREVARPAPRNEIAEAAQGIAPAESVADATSIPAYYPHWASFNGTLTDDILAKLAAGTIIGFHHNAGIDEILDVLKSRSKSFRVGWYVECNLMEPSEKDLTRRRVPISDRIRQAREKQDQLIARGIDHARFTDLLELDAARDKREGFEPHWRIPGNKPDDFFADAEEVKKAGFKYHAKNLNLALVDELRNRHGKDFVPRIVIEDVSGPAEASDEGADQDGVLENAGYRDDALALAARDETLTLVIHNGFHGGFHGTRLAKARKVARTDFKQARVEVLYGLDDDFMRLKSFGAPAVPITPVTEADTVGTYRVNARPYLYLRGGPGTTFDPKRELPSGTLVDVLGFVDGEGGRWALVDLDHDGGRDGFVFARFLMEA